MIEKRITIDCSDPINTFQVISKDGLTKTAGETSEEIASFVRNLKKDTERYVYVLINAMGAEEFYGDNNNHDSFPEYLDGVPNLISDSNAWGYKTFQTNAHLFKHHRNKDPKNKYGDVLLSVYNHKMHRPELIVRIDRQRAPEEAKKVDKGEVLATSMGTKVPYDICSICGNRAKTREEYCTHLKHKMGKILDNGKKVFAINPRPKFFDISMVFIPADSTSRVLKKLASLDGSKPTVKNASIKSASDKIAEIKKYIRGGKVIAKGMDNIVENLVGRKMDALSSREVSISPDRLDNISSKFDIPTVLSSMAYGGIVPKPHEFQRIVLTRMGKGSFADVLDKKNIIFDRHTANNEDARCNLANILHQNADLGVIEQLSDLIPYRSSMQPLMSSRLSGRGLLFSPEAKRTPMNMNPLMASIGGMYNKFMSSAPSSVYNTMGRLLIDSGMAPPTKKIIVIKASVPGSMSEKGGLGNFLTDIIFNRFGTSNVDSNPLDRIKYFLSKIIPLIANTNRSNKAVSVGFRNSMMGTPLLRYISTSGPSVIKVASMANGADRSDGRRWLIDVLSNRLRGIDKIAHMDKRNFNGDLHDVTTLVELGKLV